MIFSKQHNGAAPENGPNQDQQARDGQAPVYREDNGGPSNAHNSAYADWRYKRPSTGGRSLDDDGVSAENGYGGEYDDPAGVDSNSNFDNTHDRGFDGQVYDGVSAIISDDQQHGRKNDGQGYGPSYDDEGYDQKSDDQGDGRTRDDVNNGSRSVNAVSLDESKKKPIEWSE